jgi:predicted ribosomally synthesized peptide with SipW-like signal peptide
MKKRNLMLGSAILLVVLLVAGGTFAWFTATTEEVTNSFTAGTLDIELIDEFEGALNVNPGDCYEKIVYVNNLGTKRAFVRIAKDMVFDNPQLDLGVVTYELGEGWVEHDGYFYYTEELAAKDGNTIDRTTDLFAMNENETQICFLGAEMGNDYQGAKLDINIKAEAIQVTNGAAADEWGIDPLTLATVSPDA